MLQNAPSTPATLPYLELNDKVWAKETCAGCRACITVCPSNTLAYDVKLSRPYFVSPCVDCKACLDACPRTPENLQKFTPSNIIGNYLETKCARAVMDAPDSQNGGVVTALLETAMEEGFIDCAIVMGGDKWAQKAQPVIAYYPEDLRRAAGSKYDSNAVLESMKGLIKDSSINNVAIVGTPCTIESIGLLRKSPNEYAQKLASKVRFSIGLFCFESFADGMVADVTGRLNVPAWRIAKMNAGEGKMTVTLRDGTEKAIPLSSLVEHVKPGCKYCGDFTAKLSDISVGSVGSKPGTSSVIVRTVEGMGLYQIAKENGYIEEDCDVNVAAVEKIGKLKVKKNGF